MNQHQNRRRGKPHSPQQQRDPGNRVYESTSAKGKIRGTARQLVERYLQFAEEARLANDRVASEAFLQSAEHYVRLSNPVRHTENQPVKYQPHARAPIAIETSSSAGNAPLNNPVDVVGTGQTLEPEPSISNEAKAQSRLEAIKQEHAEIAMKRAAAADALERVAGQHGYTLAQLGLALQSQ